MTKLTKEHLKKRLENLKRRPRTLRNVRRKMFLRAMIQKKGG